MVALAKSMSVQAIDHWSERRNFPRREMNTSVLGRRLDHSIEARQMPRLTLNLRDLSLGGLSAVSDQPLGAGEHIVVAFPSQGRLHGWDAFGRVLRCENSAMGYRVAVEFDPLPAA